MAVRFADGATLFKWWPPAFAASEFGRRRRVLCGVRRMEMLGGPVFGRQPNGDGSIGCVPRADQQACITAVSRKINNTTVKVLDAISSGPNNNVTAGIGSQKAKWRCLVKNGNVADVMPLSDEGEI